jgi:hypothetical protein
MHGLAWGLALTVVTGSLAAQSPPPDLPGPRLAPAAAEALFTPLLLEESLQAGAAAPVPAVFGARGTRRINYSIGGGFQPGELDNILGEAGVGLSYFIADNLSLDLELNGVYYGLDGKNSAGANANLLFRWHFVAEPNWSIYFDGGAGLMGTSDEVPAKGTNFNFTPQAGVGLSLEIAPDVRLMSGVRWLHVSNANLFDNNPGMDNVLLYLGVSLPF